MSIFEKLFIKKLEENNAAGLGGVFGDTPSMGHGGAVGNTDFWNTGETRIAKGGKKQKRTVKPKKANKKGSKHRKKTEKTHNGSLETLIPMQKRPFSVNGLN